jgi:magnesium chelatase subunit D
MTTGCVFPFTAVIGQERVKQALVLNAVNPRIGGVLISGEKGTAKSTLVRGLADVIDMAVIDLPLNVTEDRLVGSIDIEAAITGGRKCFEPGLMQKADGNILYIDEVNLLSEHIANCLLEAAASGENIVEREGVSHRHASRFILVGTMNPEEGTLRPQLLDRFGLYAEVHGEPDRAQRVAIIRRRLEFERNPGDYLAGWREEAASLRGIIERAKTALPLVDVTEKDLQLAASVAREAGCAGHRADIIIIETARAVAALEGRTALTDDDLRRAAGYALPHRMREAVPVTREDDTEQPEATTEQTEEPPPPETDPGGSDTGIIDSVADTANPPQNDRPLDSGETAEPVEDPAGAFDIRIADMQYDDFRRPRGSGKRARVKSGSRQGRYVRYRLPNGRITDLAFDATLRAAAPFQNVRREPGLAVVIKPGDLRERVREKHTGCVILFVVDASGSMGARHRMRAVKGAVLSLLGDAYRKRDRVGLVAFRGRGAATLLGITRSIDLACKHLRELPTGGKTPLASGLYRACELLKAARIREPDMLPYLVLVSDGRANVSLNGGNAADDAVAAAGRIRQEGIGSMVLDTEAGYIRLGLAKRLAEVLGANYVKLDDISTQEITSSVKSFIH